MAVASEVTLDMRRKLSAISYQLSARAQGSCN